MRYEAKHSYFKKLAQSIGNFINLPYTLAMRHQQLQCYLNVNTNDMPGWNNNVEVGKGYSCMGVINTIELKFYLQQILTNSNLQPD